MSSAFDIQEIQKNPVRTQKNLSSSEKTQELGTSVRKIREKEMRGRGFLAFFLSTLFQWLRY